jgi:putative oxidoreductase
VAFAGPGRFSLDRVIGLDLEGSTWGLAALGLAVAAGLLTLIMRAANRTPAAAVADEDERMAA